jgi:uncharacterized protein YjbI with pentapeptide repeats
VLLSVVLAWWVVPFTLYLFWVRYVPKHYPFGTAVHIVLLVASLGFGLLFHRAAKETLRDEKRSTFRLRSAFKDFRVYARGLMAIGLGGIAYLSIAAISGSKQVFAVPVIGYRPYADLSQDTTHLKNARLRGANLRYVKANGASLVRSNLVEADLSGADLFDADLQEANLAAANLQGADLLSADLWRAKLGGAKLQESDLSRANLQGADLVGANLQGATLVGTDLRGADLQSAGLREVNLRNAKVGGAIFKYASLAGADVSRIEDWIEIDSITWANVYGVRNPPPEFLAWAIKGDAVCERSHAKWQEAVDKGNMKELRAAPGVDLYEYCGVQYANARGSEQGV